MLVDSLTPVIKIDLVDDHYPPFKKLINSVMNLNNSDLVTRRVFDVYKERFKYVLIDEKGVVILGMTHDGESEANYESIYGQQEFNLFEIDITDYFKTPQEIIDKHLENILTDNTNKVIQYYSQFI